MGELVCVKILNIEPDILIYASTKIFTIQLYSYFIIIVEIVAVIWSCRLFMLYKNPQDQNKGMFFATSTRLNLDKLMSELFETHSEWIVDSYHFDPCGYSFNALNGYKILNSCEYLIIIILIVIL